MPSINDSLSQELLFKIFKYLDSKQMVKVTRTCKQWAEIINEHNSFWKKIYLPETSLTTWDPSILPHLTSRVDEGLEEVDIRVKIEGGEIEVDEEDEEGEDQEQANLWDCLHESSHTLTSLFLLREDDDNIIYGNWDCSHLLSCFRKLRALRLIDEDYNDTRLVRLLFKAPIGTSTGLQVLWLPFLSKRIISEFPDKFQNLVSLDLFHAKSTAEWKRFLKGPCKTLKHLSFCIDDEHSASHEEDSDSDSDSEEEEKEKEGDHHLEDLALSFPNLRLLDFQSNDSKNSVHFPGWMEVPSSVVLICERFIENLPSVSGIFIKHLEQWKVLFDQCPAMKELRFFRERMHSYEQENLLSLLKMREVMVKGGLEVKGIKIEQIQTLVIPFKNVPEHVLQQYRSLVGEVLDLHSNAVSDWIELEIN